jgi:hypothetical protein
MQPGDNYRIVASMTDAQQQGFHAEHPDPDGLGRVFDGNNQPVTTTNHPNVRMSDMLTVWRRLYVERDHMDGPPRGEPFTARGAKNTERVGDDDVNPGGQLADPSIALMESEYVRAYIRVDHDDSTAPNKASATNRRIPVPWEHNLQDLSRTSRWMKDVQSTFDFWSIQIVGAYEGQRFRDNDPNGLFGFDKVDAGRTRVTEDNHEPVGGDGPSYIFLESIADFVYHETLLGTNVVPEGTLIRRTVLHESLRHFKGLKFHMRPPDPPGPADEGPMNGQINAYGADQQNKITPKQLNLMRNDPLPG